MGVKKVSSVKSILGILALVISGALFIYILKFAWGADIWYDEVFSLMFVRGGVSDIIEATARDVHPPLYYIYLKVFTSTVTGVMGKESFFFAAKFASLFPWLVLFAIDVFYIRKRFGLFVSGIFAFLITAMPQLSVYYLEIRMYSLALLLVTAHVLVAESIVSSGEKSFRIKWALFFILGISTAYTQYYACIATIGIYLATLIILFTDKDSQISKKKAAWILLSASLSCILYLPWLPVLLSQIGNISGSYWIQPLTIRSLAGCVKFATLPEGNTALKAYACVGLMLLVIIVAFVLTLKSGLGEDKSGRGRLLRNTVLMLAPAFLVVLSGFVLSALGTPIFIYRYLVPTLGAFWLLVAIILDGATNRLPLFLLIIPFILIGEMNLKGFSTEEQKKLDQAGPAFEAVNEIPENSVVITNFDHVTSVIAYYRPDIRVYLYEAPVDKLLIDGLGNITELTKDADVQELTATNSDVYFLGSFNSREEIVENWKEQGVSSKLLGEALIERYWINIYRLY